MTRPSVVAASPAFDGIARGAQFRDQIAIVVQAPPAVTRVPTDHSPTADRDAA